MDDAEESGAWLETSEGARHPLHGKCSLGRTAANDLVLDSPKVSRRHALVHVQNIGEFWLIDFGSSNGTFLNNRRIQHPMRLHDGDQITIGETRFTFREPQVLSEEYKTLIAQRTIREVENVACWLLVADIRNFTPLSRSMENESLEAILGAWLAVCDEIIEARHGTINKYLGDSFLAYWREEETSPQEIVAVLAALKEVQMRRAPEFRVVLHLGSVAIGGIASMGEESLLGREVNFIFRLEKLAGSLGELCGLSDTAHEKLGAVVATQPLGAFELKGFDKPRTFFAAR